MPPRTEPHAANPELATHVPDAAATAESPDEQVSLGHMRWRVCPAWKEVLFGPHALRLPQWLADGQAVAVKSRPHRTVYRVDLPQGSFYVKQYRSIGWRDRLRDLLRGSRAHREWRRILRVRQRRIATVTPLALGVPRRPLSTADAYLITAARPAQPLEHYLQRVLPTLPPPLHTRARQRVAKQLARFVAAIHEAGITHRDLHPGNVLIEQTRPQTDEQPTAQCDDRASAAAGTHAPGALLLVDLQAVSIRPDAEQARRARPPHPEPPPGAAPLDWCRSRRNLVTLNLYFSQHATRSDRARFWRCYLRCRPALVADPKAAARMLEQQTARAARRFWRRRDRRSLRHGRYFYRFRRRSLRAYAVRELPRQALERLAAAPDAPFDGPEAQVLKRSSGSQLARIALHDGRRTINCICKRWQPRNRRQVVLGWLRAGKAWHAWRIGHALRLRGIATPRPLAVIERRTRRAGKCSYVVWEEIAHAQHLHAAAERLAALPPPRRRLACQRLANRLARILRRLHDAGFYHPDLKAANILVQGPPDAPAGVYLLDLDAVGCRRALTWRRRLRDLSRLLVSFYRAPAVTRAARLRFFDAYLYGGIAAHPSWKARCRYVDCLARRKIRRNQRLGRVIA